MDKNRQIKEMIQEINRNHGKLLQVDKSNKVNIDSNMIKESQQYNLILDLIAIINMDDKLETENTIFNRALENETNEDSIKMLIEDFNWNENALGRVIIIENSDDIDADNILQYFETLDIAALLYTKENSKISVIYYQYKNKKDEKLNEFIYENITTDLMIKIKMGISSNVCLKDLKRGYIEAKEVIKLASKFELVKPINYYDDMLIYRVVANMSEIDKNILIENIKEKKIDLLDKDDIRTANVFLECNLNISDASRKLFIHRNTLIYRLEKIQKLTNYDLKIFKDAMEFRIIILVLAYRKVQFEN